MSAPENEDDKKDEPPDKAKSADSESGDKKGMPALTPEDVEMIGGRAISTQPEPPTSPPPPPPVTSPITVTANPPPPPPVTSPITVTANPPPPPPVTSPITVTGSPPPPPPDPYDPNFDCQSASPTDVQTHNNLVAANNMVNAIKAEGAGVKGGSSGYNAVEYISFSYNGPDGVMNTPPVTSGSINSVESGFTLTSDTLTIGDLSIPISQITGYTHNHPSTGASNQAELPLPSTTNNYVSTGSSGPLQGDYNLMQYLVDNGADANAFILGVYAETSEGAGYQLYTYPYSEEPPYDPYDSTTWAGAYGPTPPSDLTPCD